MAALSNADPTTAPAVPAGVLDTLKREHPRVLATKADFDRMRQAYQNNPTFRTAADQVIQSADKILTEPISQYELPDGKRLLKVSGKVKGRTTQLATAFHLTTNRKYVDRAWAELEAAAKFKDWNPPHFLDTGEMTAGFAIGYDWLYNEWTPEQRKTLRNAIVQLGLKPGVASYDRGAWWVTGASNWNQVCNGGLAMGALAVADTDPEIAARVIVEAVKGLPHALTHFGPDGAWSEGPGYWRFGLSSTSQAVSAMQTALGTDFGLTQLPGLEKAGFFALHVVGPTGMPFNFADSHPEWTSCPAIWWLAKSFNQPLFKSLQVKHAIKNASPLDLLWGDLAANEQIPPTTPTDAYFRDTEIAFMRTAWNDPAAMWVGLKAGKNGVIHGHLDIGCFVLDAKGQRFVMNVGSDNYNLPGYRDTRRYPYYRTRAEGKNSLVIGETSADKPDQNPKASTKIERFQSNADRAFAIADITNAYPDAARAVRGVWLNKKGNSTLIEDEIETKKPETVWWFAHTEAAIKLSDSAREATLTMKDQSIRVRIIEPAAAVFTVRDAVPLPTSPQPEKQAVNKGVKKLSIELKEVKNTRIAVQFEAADATDAPIQPLAEWK